MEIPRMNQFTFNSFQKYVFFLANFKTCYMIPQLQYPRIADSRYYM